MGLGALISIGTAGYSEREARRVRAVNVAAFIAAAAVSIYIVVIPGPNDPVTYCVVAGFLCAPLLHRFGPIAAPVLLLSLVWINAVRVMVTYGNSDGIVLSLLTSAALSVVLFGIDRLRLATAVMALVAVGAPALYLSVPAIIGDISEALMRASFALNLVLNLAILFAVVAYFARIAQQAEDRAAAEAARSDRLLRAMLPDAVAEALKARPGAVIAERHPAVSVVFADIEGFTALAGRTDPETLVTFLDRVYGAFDDALARHGLTKIKTSGDALLAVAGLPAPMPNHAGAAARCALDMIGAAAAMRDPDGRPVALRIGLASGAVVAGVVGKSRFFYDVWGDTVNLAARLQASGIAGQVHVAEAARAMLPDTVAPELRGTMELKGIGLVRTWLLAPPGA